MGIFPRLKKSMCGCSLETATKIIGWYSVMAHTFAFIYYLKQYSHVGKGINFAEKELLGSLIAKEVSTSVLHTITDVLLLIGVYSRRPSYIFVWIIFGSLPIIQALIWTIISLVHTLQFFEVVQGSISFVTGCYFIAIVNGHYEDLKSVRAGVQ